MSYMAVFMVFLAGITVGYVFKKDKKGIEILMSDRKALEYNALTPNSKRYVNGLIEARGVHDERTTYRRK
jgi:hypothetical protein